MEIGIDLEFFFCTKHELHVCHRRDWLIEKNYQTADNHYLAFQTSSNEIERKHGLSNPDVEFSMLNFFFFSSFSSIYPDLLEKGMEGEKIFIISEIVNDSESNLFFFFFDNLRFFFLPKNLRTLEKKIQSVSQVYSSIQIKMKR